MERNQATSSAKLANPLSATMQSAATQDRGVA